MRLSILYTTLFALCLCGCGSAAPSPAVGPSSASGFGLLLEDYQSFMISELVDETTAGNITQLTVGFWVKPSIPLPQCEIFSYWVEAGLIWAPSGNIIFPPATPSPPTMGDSTVWYHIAWTIDFAQGLSNIYQDGVLVANSSADFGRSLPANGRFGFGRGISDTYFGRPAVSLDGAFAITRILTIEEIMEVASTAVLSPTYQSDILFAYSFDRFSWTQPYTIRSDYPAGLSSFLIKGIWQTSPGLLAPPLEPALIPSDAPATGSPAIPFKQIAFGTPVDLILGSSYDSIVILSLPTNGSVYLRSSQGQATGSALAAADLPLTVSVGVIYDGSFSIPRDTFDILINSTAITVYLLANNGPAPRNTEYYVPQRQTRNVLLTRAIFYPPDRAKSSDFYMVDRDGDSLTCTIMSISGPTGLQSLSTDSGAITSLPFVSQDCRVFYTAPSSQFGPNVTVLTISVSDGLVAANSTLSFTVLDEYLPPLAENVAATAAENQLIEITFPEAVNSMQTYTVVKNGGTVTEPIFIDIEDFPTEGTLYQMIGNSSAKSNDTLTAVDPLFENIQQWASQVYGVSSEYVTAGTDYLASQTLGPPDVFPEYGDNVRAWSPLYPQENEWIALTFPEAVYPTRIDIFQTWSSNLIWRISALDESTNEFVILWQIEQRFVVMLDFAAIFSPPLCPVSFKTRTIKIESAPPQLGSYYVEIDAVSLTGTRERQQRSLVNYASGKVVFQPKEYFHGNQSFTYRVNRCRNYARYRDINAPRGTVNMTITSVNQAPLISALPINVDASNYTLTSSFSVEKTFKLPVLDVDGTPLTATLRSSPSSGSLRLASSSGALIAGSSFLATEDLIYRTDSCRTRSGKYNATFSVQITDGASSVEGTVTLTVDCDGNVRRVSTGVEILIFVLCAISSVIVMAYGVLIVVWRGKKSIHNISPLFCLLTITGALLSNISPIFLTISLNACMGWLAFLTLGCCVFFGAIAAKTYRIDRIFHTQSMKVFSVPNRTLLLYVGVVVAIQIILLGIWAGVLPISIQIIPTSSTASAELVSMCLSKSSPIVQGVQYSFLFLLFLFTAIFAWRVRRIPLKEYKESREIFFATYNVGFVALTSVILASIFWYDPNASTAVTAVGTIVASTVSIVILYTGKLANIARGIESDETPSGGGSINNNSVRGGTGRSSSKSPGHSMNYSLRSDRENSQL